MRVVVVGGGFAGIAAAKKLYNQLAFENKTEIMLIDRNEYTTMMPSLPDIAGNKFRQIYAKERLENIVPKGIKLLKKNVQYVDFDRKTIHMENKEELDYDFLIFSPGSKTDYSENAQVFKNSHTVDSLENALELKEDLYRQINSGEIEQLVIAGGSYTGIQLATSLQRFIKHCDKKINISIVTSSDRLLTTLDDMTAKYTEDKLKSLGINLLYNEEVLKAEDKKITLKSGTVLDGAFLCWCKGLRIAIETFGKHKTLSDGRIIVDEFLKVPEHPEVFVAGDAAAVKTQDNYLRRAVGYSIPAGKCAGKNMAAKINGQSLKAYKPKDKGWIIPMQAYSIGKIYGLQIKGGFGLFMHYFICGIHNYSFRNFRKYLKIGLKHK